MKPWDNTLFTPALVEAPGGCKLPPMDRRAFFAALLALPIAARAAFTKHWLIELPDDWATMYRGVPVQPLGCIPPGTIVGIDDKFVTYWQTQWKLTAASPNRCARIENLGG